MCLTNVVRFQQCVLRPKILCVFFILQNHEIKKYAPPPQKKRKNMFQKKTNIKQPSKKNHSVTSKHCQKIHKQLLYQWSRFRAMHIPSGKGSHSDCWNSPMLNGKYIDSIRVHFPLLPLIEEILHLFISSLPYYLQGFIHPRWCRISSINRMLVYQSVYTFPLPYKASQHLFPLVLVPMKMAYIQTNGRRTLWLLEANGT